MQQQTAINERLVDQTRRGLQAMVQTGLYLWLQQHEDWRIGKKCPLMLQSICNLKKESYLFNLGISVGVLLSSLKVSSALFISINLEIRLGQLSYCWKATSDILNSSLTRSSALHSPSRIVPGNGIFHRRLSVDRF